MFNDTVFWLKQRLFRQSAMRQYLDALRCQSLSREELAAENWRRRVRIVEHAYNNIPFYKEFYDAAGLKPEMLRSPDDWVRVPALDKETVRQNAERMRQPGLPQSVFGTGKTSGSTGNPLMVYTDRRFCIEVLGWRAFGWWGLSPADNVGIAHRRVPMTFAAKLKNRALWFPTYRAYLNASSVSEDEALRFLGEVNSHKVKWIQGYVGALDMLAEYTLKHNVKTPSLVTVWSTAAPMSRAVRERLERAFGCKAMDQYGCNEVLNIAMQCPAGENLHIHSDCIHVDSVDSDGKLLTDEEGDLLVTNLMSFAAPLIKYRMGDRGTLLSAPCPCGNPLSIMKPVKGRVSDSFTTPGGVCVNGDYLNSVFDLHSEHVSQFMLVQHEDFSVTMHVKVRQRDSAAEAAVNAVKARLEADFRGEVPVEVLYEENIPNDRGKIRYIVNERAGMRVPQN